MKVYHTTNIDNQTIVDLLITALEGGSNYWYFIPSFKRIKVNGSEGKNYDEAFLDRLNNHESEPNYSVSVYDIETVNENDDTDTWDWLGTISVLSIKTALREMAENRPSDFLDVLNGNFDANTADIFLQLVVMGEVRYG